MKSKGFKTLIFLLLLGLWVQFSFFDCPAYSASNAASPDRFLLAAAQPQQKATPAKKSKPAPKPSGSKNKTKATQNKTSKPPEAKPKEPVKVADNKTVPKQPAKANQTQAPKKQALKQQAKTVPPVKKQEATNTSPTFSEATRQPEPMPWERIIVSLLFVLGLVSVFFKWIFPELIARVPAVANGLDALKSKAAGNTPPVRAEKNLRSSHWAFSSLPDAPPLTVHSSTPLGQGKDLHVIELDDGRQLLVGSTQNYMSVLAELNQAKPAQTPNSTSGEKEFDQSALLTELAKRQPLTQPPSPAQKSEINHPLSPAAKSNSTENTSPQQENAQRLTPQNISARKKTANNQNENLIANPRPSASPGIAANSEMLGAAYSNEIPILQDSRKRYQTLPQPLQPQHVKTKPAPIFDEALNDDYLAGNNPADAYLPEDYQPESYQTKFLSADHPPLPGSLKNRSVHNHSVQNNILAQEKMRQQGKPGLMPNTPEKPYLMDEYLDDYDEVY